MCSCDRAREALSIGVYNVNSHIASYLARSRDQICCRRKKVDYKAILKSLESDAQCSGPDGNQARAVPDSPINEYPTNGDPARSGGRSSYRRHPMVWTPNWPLFLDAQSRLSSPKATAPCL